MALSDEAKELVGELRRILTRNICGPKEADIDEAVRQAMASLMIAYRAGLEEAIETLDQLGWTRQAEELRARSGQDVSDDK